MLSIQALYLVKKLSSNGLVNRAAVKARKKTKEKVKCIIHKDKEKKALQFPENNKSKYFQRVKVKL